MKGTESKGKKISLVASVKKYWYLCAAYLLVVYVLSQIVVYGNSLIAQATDQLFAGEDIILQQLLIPFIILTVCGTVTAFLADYLKNLFSVHVQIAVKNTAVSKIVNLQYSYFDTTSTGSIMNRLISDVSQVELLFSETVTEILSVAVCIITVGAYIFTMNYKLFFVTAICYPVLLWAANALSKKIGKLTGNRRGLYDKLEETALDMFQGMIVGRTYNLNNVTGKRMDRVIDGILENEYIRTKISAVSFIIGNIIRWIPRLVCYIYAMYAVISGDMTVGALLAFAMLLSRIVHPMGEIPSLFNAYREQMVSFKRIDEIVKQPEERSGTHAYSQRQDFGTEPAIELEHISFSYEGERNIFQNLNMTIEAGKNTALVGSSGGGKSTVFKILCGFYYPQSGNYKLFGHPFAEWDIKELRKQFSLVSQNVFLFPDTIAANVAYGKDGASFADVVAACKNANIHDFIESLPDGYDTYVGERGVKLSGGQRQRISIARGFLKGAPILLLDEPTSAVDVETESLIQSAIDKISAGKTVITIAHRLSTIENADRILVFDKGFIAEQGTHEKLMNNKGVYYHLYNSEKSDEHEMIGGGEPIWE